MRQYLNRADRNKYSELQKKVESFQATSPLAPPRAMVVVDNAQPIEPRVLIRGNPARPGKEVPRQFLLVMSRAKRASHSPTAAAGWSWPEAIVVAGQPAHAARDRQSPLDAPLRRAAGATPSDFGIRSEPPTHPELLD